MLSFYFLYESGDYLDDSETQVAMWHLEGLQEFMVGWMIAPPLLHVWDIWVTLG